MAGVNLRKRWRRGVTLIEVTLAGSLFALIVLALFEGIAVAARISLENAEYLAADAYAFDLAWKRFNEGYAALDGVRKGLNDQVLTETISSNAVPVIYRSSAPARSYTAVRRAKDRNNEEDASGLVISVDVEWGPANRRRRLSATHTATVFVSGLGRGDG